MPAWVTIAPATGGILALKLAQGEWRLKGVQGGNLSIAAEIPEDFGRHGDRRLPLPGRRW